MKKSIMERISEFHSNKKLLSEQQREQVRLQVMQGELDTEKQKELYRIHAERAIGKAREAIANNNSQDKQIAMRELKVAYGFYHYMSSMHFSFRLMHSQMDMQDATRDFAEMVKNLSSIRLTDKPVNFASLTRKALKNFSSLDVTGLDKMVDSLVRGSIAATESEQADDAFLEALVTGKASLDTPYPSKTLEVFDNSRTNTENTASPAAGNDDIMALLERMANGLKDE